MIELPFDSFSTADPFFRHKKQWIPALAVINGSYPGRVFTDKPQNPNMAIVWATGRWMYFGGNINTEQQKADLGAFIQEYVMPDYWKKNVNRFEIYTNESKQLDEFFLKEIDSLKVDKHYEFLYKLNKKKFLQIKNANSHIKNEVKVEFKDFYILPELAGQSSYKESQKTVGVVVKKRNSILSIAKNNGFTFGNEYFIDIDTFKAGERRKGYATLAAMGLIEYFLEIDMLPLWETTYTNIPSQKLALKLGFEPIDSYPVFDFKTT